MSSRSRTWWRTALTVGLVGGSAVVAGSEPALAACHRFAVTVSPAGVSEGAKVTVTVTRDAAVAPSSIDVETIDDTACR